MPGRYQAVGDFRTAKSQERIGRLFHADGGRDCRETLVALCLLDGVTRAQFLVVWIDLECETQIRQGVLVRAIDGGGVRKRCQFPERIRHLFRRAFKQAAAAAGEQGIAAKKPGLRRCEIGDVSTRMSGDVEHIECQLELRYGELVAFAQWMGNLRNRFAARAVNRHRKLLQQFGYAADMVSMVMSQ